MTRSVAIWLPKERSAPDQLQPGRFQRLTCIAAAKPNSMTRACATLVTPQGEHHLRSTLLGRFNLSNVLAAIGALLGLDYALDEILQVLPKLEGPAGRMQRLGGGRSRWWWSITPHPGRPGKVLLAPVRMPRASCCACLAVAVIAIAASVR